MFFIKLLLLLIGPLLFLFIDLLMIYTAIQSISEGNLYIFIWFTVLSLIFTFAVWRLFISFLEEYKSITKNHFLDTYVFPKELSKILYIKYPHLKKSEVTEVLEKVKEFYRFQINEIMLNENEVDVLGEIFEKVLGNTKEFYRLNINEILSTPNYMPSRVVDFACQTFFDMPNSSLFFEKLLLKHDKYHRKLPKDTAVLLTGQYEEYINSKISEMWCYCCNKENIDPFFPLSFPSFFTLDKRLKIPAGFIFELDETSFREILPISEAPSIHILKEEIEEIGNIDYLAKKIQYYLGNYDYCNLYQKKELEGLFKLIDKNKSLAHAVYGQYSDVDLFKKTVLDNSAPPPKDIGCSCGTSI